MTAPDRKIEFPLELFDRLAHEARKQGKTPSELMEEAARGLLEAQAPDAAPPEREDPRTARRFWGFISYSHADADLAVRVHRRLERYRIPHKLVGLPSPFGPVPRKLSPFFRDQDEFVASSDLGERINRALRASNFLIVICSPRAAASRWVNEEISRFRRAGGGARVLCLIGEGKPGASRGDNPELECFPPALFEELTIDGQVQISTEPLAPDVRPEADGFARAIVRLIAAMVGVDFDDLWRRDRRRHRVQVAVTVMAMTVALVASLIGLRANINARNEVNRGNAVTAASLWNRLSFRETMITADELNVLWEMRLSSPEVREAGVQELMRDGDRAVRLGRRPTQVLRAFFLRWPGEHATSALQSMARSVERTTDDEQLDALGSAMREVAGALSPESRQSAATELLASIRRTDSPGRLGALSFGVAGFSESLTTDETRQVIHLLVSSVPRITTAGQLFGVMRAVKAVPGELTSDQAHKTLETMLRTSGQIVRKLREGETVIQELPSRFAAERSLQFALGAFSDKLTSSQALAALSTVVDAWRRADADSYAERNFLAESLVSLATRLDDATAAAGFDLVLDAVRGGAASKAFGSVLASLAGRLTPQQADSRATAVLLAVQASTDRGQGDALASAVPALAPKLTAERARDVKTQALTAILRPPDGSILDLFARVSRPQTPATVERLQSDVVRALRETDIELVRRELGSALTSLSSNVAAESLDAAFRRLRQGLDGVYGEEQVAGVRSAMMTLAARVERGRASGSFNFLMSQFPGRDGTIDAPRVGTMGSVGAILAEKLTAPEKQGALDSVLARIKGTSNVPAHEALASIVGALADDLRPEQRLAAAAVMRSLLAWSPTSAESVAAAQALVRLEDPRQSAEEFTAQIVEALKYPTTSAEATTILLEALRLRWAKPPHERVDLHTAIRWMRERDPESRTINFDTLPLCPPPPSARSGLVCPSNVSRSAQ